MKAWLVEGLGPWFSTGIAESDDLALGRDGESPRLPSNLVRKPEELRRSLGITATFYGASTMGVNS